MIRMVKDLKRNKAFTLIELLVVIAVISILVLLAAPKLLGYVEKAKLTQIKNDVRAYENIIASERMRLENDDFFMSDENKVDKDILIDYVNKESLFNKRGLVDSDSLSENDYFIIDKSLKLVNSQLGGEFYLSKDGKVFYHDNIVPKDPGSPGQPENPEEPEDPDIPGESTGPTDKDLGMENDFKWVKDPMGYVGLNGERGYFSYIGKGNAEIEIPHVIQGIEMTSYYHMFYETGADVAKIKSTNENINSTTRMLAYHKNNNSSLDLTELNTTNVEEMIEMFQYSEIPNIKFGGAFNTSNVKTMEGLFYNYTGGALDLSSFNTSKVTDMSRMFVNIYMPDLDISSFDTSNVTNMNMMFSKSLNKTGTDPHLNLRNFNTSNVTNMGAMFFGNRSVSIDLGSFNTRNVENYAQMFSSSTMSTIKIASFSYKDGAHLENMFYSAKATKLCIAERKFEDAIKRQHTNPPGMKIDICF